MKIVIKGIFTLVLNIAIIFQLGCAERFRQTGMVELKTQSYPVGERPINFKTASNDPAYQGGGNGSFKATCDTSCGDSDVTQMIAANRPDFDFFKNNYLDEAILAQGPNVVAGIWVSSADGKQVPNRDNYIPFGFTQQFASKTLVAPGKTLTQLKTVGEPSVQRDIAELLSHHLDAVSVSIGGAYSPQNAQPRRIYSGLMACSRFTGKSDPNRAVPSGFQVMRLMNKNLPEALAQLDFKVSQIPSVIHYTFNFENNQANLILGDSNPAAIKDESLGQRALVIAAVDLKTAKEYASLKPETAKLIGDFEGGLKIKAVCSSLAASLPVADQAWFSGPFYSDRGIDLGIPCRILNGSGSSFSELVDGVKSHFSQHQHELAGRLARTALWLTAANAIPQDWKDQNDIRCFPDQGLYINKVLASAIFPISSENGNFIQSGYYGGKSVHPESNLASYGPSKQMYFDVKVAPSGDVYGDIQTLFAMFPIMLNGGGAGVTPTAPKADIPFASSYTAFSGNLAKVSASVALGQTLNTPAPSFVNKLLTIHFTNRALAKMPDGRSNQCGQVAATFCTSKDYSQPLSSCRGNGYPACTLSN